MKLNYKYITLFVLSFVLIFFVYRTKVYYEKDRLELLLKKKKYTYQEDFQLYIDGHLVYSGNKNEIDKSDRLLQVNQSNKVYELIADKDFVGIIAAYMRLGIATDKSIKNHQFVLSNDYFNITLKYDFLNDTLKIKNIEINHLQDTIYEMEI